MIPLISIATIAESSRASAVRKIRYPEMSNSTISCTAFLVRNQTFFNMYANRAPPRNPSREDISSKHVKSQATPKGVETVS